MSETKPDPTQDTLVLKPRRVFQCEKERRMMERKDVWKDALGKYHCGSCGMIVIDKTNTKTGRDFMEIICI